MDTQLLVKIIHMSAAGLAIVAILARAITLLYTGQSAESKSTCISGRFAAPGH